jgi:hypothetical protein
MEIGNEQLRLRWCSAFAFALLAFGQADGFLVNITYVESAVAKGAGQSHNQCMLLGLVFCLPVHPTHQYSARSAD